MTTVPYRNIPIRVIIALIGSFIILIHGKEWDSILRVTKVPKFYLAWAISFMMALGLFYVIHLITVQLDNRLSWRLQPSERCAKQALYGISIPLILEALMVAGYSVAIGERFSINDFITNDLLVVVLFIAAINLYYAIHYLILTAPKQVSETNKDDDSKTVEKLTFRYGVKTIYLDVKEDILYFHRSGSSILKIVTRDREYPFGKRSIIQMEEMYGKLGFCQINRSTLINMRFVEGYDKTETRGNFKITIKDSEILSTSNSNDLLLKKAYLKNFERCLVNGNRV